LPSHLHTVVGWCLLGGLALGGVGVRAGAPGQPPAATSDQPAPYVCPMHPDVRGRAGEHCGKCGMQLVPGAADYTPYRLDLELTPRALRAGEKGRVRFFVRHPGTGATVRTFETMHERVFHLFVVSRDLGHFAHVHPVLRRSGALDVDIAVPRPGAYQLIADFLPVGGAPQLIQRSFVTAGYTGSLSAVPDLSSDLQDKVDGGVRVALVPPDSRARREQLLTFEVTDAATSAPVANLEPYLGATGHLLVASADLSVAFHSHPVAEVSSQNGPRVVFQVVLPRAGMYRLWMQIQRGGRVSTVAFTVPVEDVESN
jgi:hypothetical protein